MRSMTSKPTSQRKYVVVDIEAIDTDIWLSMAFVVALYPDGTIVAMEEFFVDRSDHVIQYEPIKRFWENNSSALAYNMSRGIGVSEVAAETQICRYVNELRRSDPHFFLVSDNPSFDVRILDGILINHGHLALSQRTPDMYAQTLCTWSFQMAFAELFDTKISKLFQHPVVCRLLNVKPTADQYTT